MNALRIVAVLSSSAAILSAVRVSADSYPSYDCLPPQPPPPPPPSSCDGYATAAQQQLSSCCGPPACSSYCTAPARAQLPTGAWFRTACDAIPGQHPGGLFSAPCPPPSGLAPCAPPPPSPCPGPCGPPTPPVSCRPPPPPCAPRPSCSPRSGVTTPFSRVYELLSPRTARREPVLRPARLIPLTLTPYPCAAASPPPSCPGRSGCEMSLSALACDPSAFSRLYDGGPPATYGRCA